MLEEQRSKLMVYAGTLFSFERLILVGLFVLAGLLAGLAVFLTLYGHETDSAQALVGKFTDTLTIVVVAIVALMKDVFSSAHNNASTVANDQPTDPAK